MNILQRLGGASPGTWGLIVLGVLLILLSPLVGVGGYFLPPLFTSSLLQLGAVGLSLLVILALLAILIAWIRDPRIRFTTPKDPFVAIYLIVALLFSVGLWRGFGQSGFHSWEFNSGIAMMVATIGVLAISLGLVRSGFAPASFFSRIFAHPRLSIVLSALVFTGSGTLFAYYVAEGIPHVVDSVIYATQAKILMAGGLTDASPGVELVALERRLMVGVEGLYGKYPIGWPMVLSLFMLIDAGWFANVFLVLANAVLTGVIAHRILSREIAVLSVMLMLLSGFSIISSAEWLSHIATSFWLLLFYLMYEFAFIDAGLREKSFDQRFLLFSILCGLALFMAVLTRQFDALVFSIPVMAHAFVTLLRDPKRNAVLLAPVALVGACALGVLLYVNKHQIGNLFTTGYGAGYLDQLLNMMTNAATKPVDYLLWFQQSLHEVNLMWFAGVGVFLPLVVMGWMYPPIRTRRTSLFLACSGGILLAYVFATIRGISWYGPRWYLPLLPAFSILAAAGIMQLIAVVKAFDAKAVKVGDPPADAVPDPTPVLQSGAGQSAVRTIHLPNLILASILVSIVAAFAVGLPVWGLRIHVSSPNLVNAQLFHEVERQSLSNAVIGLFSADAGIVGKLNRNAVWKNDFPLESSNIIYVTQRANWKLKACRNWPGRNIYSLDSSDKFVFHPVDCSTLKKPRSRGK